jgi:hypothetical protein
MGAVVAAVGRQNDRHAPLPLGHVEDTITAELTRR